MNYEEYDAVNLPLSVRRCRMIEDGKRDIATKLYVAEQRGREQGLKQGLCCQGDGSLDNICILLWACSRALPEREGARRRSPARRRRVSPERRVRAV